MMKKARCAKWCWLIWFVVSILYILCMVFLAVGVSGISQLPANMIKVASREAGYVEDLATAVATGIDEMFSTILEEQITVATALVTQTGFTTAINKF